MDDHKTFMTERITEDAGEAFSPSRYYLKSKNDAIVAPYGSYDLFFEMTFHVIQKLGTYEDIGTPEECRKAVERPEKKTDTISLATALELPAWRMIEAGEPSRQIDVRMTYEDLGIIYDMIREKHRIEDDRK